MKGPREHALGLLAKADHDLVAAKATLPTGDALDTVWYDDEVTPEPEDARSALDTALAVRAFAKPIVAAGGEQPQAPAPEE